MARSSYDTIHDEIQRSLRLQDVVRTAQELAIFNQGQELFRSQALAQAQQVADFQARLQLSVDSIVHSTLEANKFLSHSALQTQEAIEKCRQSIIADSLAIQHSLGSTLAIQQSFQQSLAISLDLHRQLNLILPSSLNQELGRLTQIASSLPISAISLSPEGILSIGDESLPIGTVTGHIEEILTRRGLLNFRELVSWILTKTKNLSPRLRAVLVFLVCSALPSVRSPIENLLVNLASPYVDEYLVKHDYLPKREAVKAINQNVTRQIPVELLQDFRFVKARELNVRVSPSRKSPRIGFVYFGEVLRVIKAKKNWTLVERQSEDGEVLIRGWVYTRYLDKFKMRIPSSTAASERLGRLNRKESPSQFDKEFLQAAEFVLKKNEELYRRLA